MDILDLKKKAVELRKRTWELIYNHKNGHTGSDLSCTDILVALYYSVMIKTKITLDKKTLIHISKVKVMPLKFGTSFSR